MEGWREILEMGAVVRPFDGPRPSGSQDRSRFDSPWRSTLATLATELRALSAERIVLELDIQESDLRLDGMLRASARLGSPAVRLSFESRHGPIRIETAEFHTWQDNVRAVALGLEALRKIDRYGISKRGEQYRGWRQIAAQSLTPEDAVTTQEQALEVIERESGWASSAVVNDTAGAVKAALRKAHPDRGGTDGRFRMVAKARQVLGA